MYIKEEVQTQIVIEKSKFIAILMPCFSFEEYKENIKNIKKKYYDANHVCSAFISNNNKRSSDDGEPSGTAGVPILSTLEKSNLSNICCLVVRYFGGIKLGAGGLIRAYTQVTKEAIEKAILVEDILVPKYEITLSYDLANKIEYIINQETTIISKEYEVNVKYIFLCDNENTINKIEEISKGKKPIFIEKVTVQKMV